MKKLLIILISTVGLKAFAAAPTVPHLQKGRYQIVTGLPQVCDSHFTLESWRNPENKTVVQLGSRFTYIWENVHNQQQQDDCVYGTSQIVMSDATQSQLNLTETETCPNRSGDSQRDILTIKENEIHLDVKFLKPTASGWAVDESLQGYSCVWTRLPASK